MDLLLLLWLLRHRRGVVSSSVKLMAFLTAFALATALGLLLAKLALPAALLSLLYALASGKPLKGPYGPELRPLAGDHPGEEPFRDLR